MNKPSLPRRKARTRTAAPAPADAGGGPRALPCDIEAQLHPLHMAVARPWSAGEALWNWCGPAERERLTALANECRDEDADDADRAPATSELERCMRALGGPLGMFRALHPEVSKPRAVVELAELVGAVVPAQAQRLRERLGVIDGAGPGAVSDRFRIKPHWDRQTGRLYYGDVLVRKVRPHASSTMVNILDEFESRRWPAAIINPLDTPQALYDAVGALNDMAPAEPPIRFRAGDGATHVMWERVAPRS